MDDSTQASPLAGVAQDLSRPLLHYLRRYTGNPDLAEDLLQETLIRIGAVCRDSHPMPSTAATRASRWNSTQRTSDFSLDVRGVTGFCATGDAYATQQIATKTIPVLSCEGPCIRGEIARQAANLITQEVPSLSRACHGEAFFVPHSAMASWVRGAEKTVMIDGCFLKCHGRVLNALVGEEKVVHVDALPLYYTNVFSMEDVSEAEQKAVARQVADQIIARLKRRGVIPGEPA